MFIFKHCSLEFIVFSLQICAVCLEEFKQKDELGICPCKHAFHRK